MTYSSNVIQSIFKLLYYLLDENKQVFTVLICMFISILKRKAIFNAKKKKEMFQIFAKGKSIIYGIKYLSLN